MIAELLEEELKLYFIRESRVLTGHPTWQWLGLRGAFCLSQSVSVTIELKLGTSWKFVPEGKVFKTDI